MDGHAIMVGCGGLCAHAVDILSEGSTSEHQDCCCRTCYHVAVVVFKEEVEPRRSRHLWRAVMYENIVSYHDLLDTQ